VISGYLTLNKL